MARPKRTAREMSRPNPPDIRPTSVYEVYEVPPLVRLGREVVRDALKSGALRSAKFGSTRRVLGSWVIAWLESVAETPRPPSPPPDV